METHFNYLSYTENARLPQRLTKELNELFHHNLSKAHGKTPIASDAISISTQKYRVQGLILGFRELRKGGFAIQTPWNLSEKHIRYLVNFWVNEKKLSPGTVENKLTYWRTLATWMRKHQLVGTMDDYIERPSEYRRYYTAEQDKSWEAARINVDEVIARLCKRDRWVAMQVELQAAFGLRTRESMLLRPLKCLGASGQLHVSDGTKRRRPRVVPIDSEWQYDVLIRAARLANPRTGWMIPDPWSLEEWNAHFYYVLRKEGVTRRGQGVTADGLRHGYVQKMYEEVTGEPAPIKRPDHRPNPRLHHAAMQRLMDAAGQNLAKNATARISNLATVGRVSRPIVSASEAIAALIAAHGNKSVAAKSLNISRQALYRILEKEDRSAPRAVGMSQSDESGRTWAVAGDSQRSSLNEPLPWVGKVSTQYSQE